MSKFDLNGVDPELVDLCGGIDPGTDIPEVTHESEPAFGQLDKMDDFFDNLEFGIEPLQKTVSPATPPAVKTDAKGRTWDEQSRKWIAKECKTKEECDQIDADMLKLISAKA